MSVFTDMAEACIDVLEPEERTRVPMDIFAKIVHTCAQHAENNMCQREAPIGGLPTPPLRQPTRAPFLVRGDYVWRDDFAFDVVDTVVADGSCVLVRYSDGAEEYLELQDLRLVAACRQQADDWNLQRVLMDADTLHALAETYGTYTR